MSNSCNADFQYDWQITSSNTLKISFFVTFTNWESDLTASLGSTKHKNENKL